MDNQSPASTNGVSIFTTASVNPSRNFAMQVLLGSGLTPLPSENLAWMGDWVYIHLDLDHQLLERGSALAAYKIYRQQTKLQGTYPLDFDSWAMILLEHCLNRLSMETKYLRSAT
jgi:hypothetical protein